MEYRIHHIKENLYMKDYINKIAGLIQLCLLLADGTRIERDSV